MRISIKNPAFLGVSRGFTPLTISGCVAWYDASDSTTITKSSNRVSQWNDKSASGWNLTQATGGSQPLWVSADQNGKDVISFVGAREMDNTSYSSENATAHFTKFIVNSYANATTNAYPMYSGGTGGNGQQLGGDRYFRASNDSNYAYYTESGITMNLNETVYDGTGSGNSGRLNAWLRGVSKTLTYNGTVPATTSAVNGLTVGSASGAAYLEGKICEIIIYNTTLSSGDRILVENYLIAKWGL